MLKKFVLLFFLMGNILIASSPNVTDTKKLKTKKDAQSAVKKMIEAKPINPKPHGILATILVRNVSVPDHYKNVFISASGEIIGSYQVTYDGNEPYRFVENQ